MVVNIVGATNHKEMKKMNKTYEEIIDEMKEMGYQWNVDTYGEDGEPILKITKSSLMSYEWCPKKYEFSYIERLPQDQTEAMRKGTIVHNAREEFFNEFDIKKAETMEAEELIDYCSSLFPVDEYAEMYMTIASFEAQRFLEARGEGKTHEYLPIVNEGLFDAEIIIPKNFSKKYPLKKNYTVRLQGIIDRIFIENGNLIPFELKTGNWSDSKVSGMRKEMAFYQLMLESCPVEVLEKYGLNSKMEVSHWGWYYPAADHFYVEPIIKTSMTSLKNSIAKLIKAYEEKNFEPKFYAPTCSKYCSFYGKCSAENGFGF
jgi:RecB family exonuclease